MEIYSGKSHNFISNWIVTNHLYFLSPKNPQNFFVSPQSLTVKQKLSSATKSYQSRLEMPSKPWQRHQLYPTSPIGVFSWRKISTKVHPETKKRDNPILFFAIGLFTLSQNSSEWGFMTFFAPHAENNYSFNKINIPAERSA